MSKRIYYLDKRMLIEKNTGSGVEIEAPTTLAGILEPPKPELQFDLDFLDKVNTTIARKRAREDEAIEAMISFADECEEMLLTVTEQLQVAKEQLQAMEQPWTPVPLTPISVGHAFAMQPRAMKMASPFAARGFMDTISSTVKSVSKSINNALGSIGKFIDSINPMNGFSALKNLAEFLACPEQSFLADIKNAVNDIKGTISNINPKQLLNSALESLSKHILDAFPVINDMLNFFNDINSLFKTDYDRVDALTAIHDLLYQHGKGLDYFDNYDVMGNIKDLLDPKNPIYTNPDMKIPGALPESTVSNKCSALGKIIAALEESYRTGHVFDDLITDKAILKYVEDPDLRKAIDNLLGVSPVSGIYYDASEQTQNLGYHGRTATNNTLAVAMINNKELSTSLKDLDSVGDDELKFHTTKMAVETKLDNLTDINNVAHQRILAFREGVSSVQRENDYYDLSRVMGEPINA